MSRALITGGAGFVGSHLAEELLQRGEEVFVIDDLSTGRIDNIEPLKRHPKFHYVIDSVHNEPVLADRTGTLTSAPGPYDRDEGGVRLCYRPVRHVGEWHEVYRTNRDYLGVVWAVGPDQDAVDAAVADFIAANRWEITP